jgi:hypothetical protein
LVHEPTYQSLNETIELAYDQVFWQTFATGLQKPYTIPHSSENRLHDTAIFKGTLVLKILARNRHKAKLSQSIGSNVFMSLSQFNSTITLGVI